MIGRTVGELVGDRLRTGPLLALLVEVELARGDVAAAEAAASRLAECSQGADSPVLRAQAARVAGLVAVRQGNHQRAVESFQTAQRELGNQEQPVLGATVRLEAAQVLAAAADTAAAVTEARAALAVFDAMRASPSYNKAVFGIMPRGDGAQLAYMRRF